MGTFKINNGYLYPINVAGTTDSDSVGIILKDSIYNNTGIFNGNGDGGGDNGVANLIIKSWYGVGFVDGCTGKGMTVGINCRTGTITANTFTGNLNGNATSASSVPWSGITGKPSSFTPASHTHSYLPLSGGTLTGITTISYAHTGGGMLQLSSTSNNESSISYNSGGTSYWVVGKGCGGTGNGTFAWWYNPSGKNMMTLNSSGNLHLTGNTISFGGSMTQNTSPTVVATYTNNNSANGLGFAYASDLSVGYAITADETNVGRGGGSIPWAGSFDSEPDVTAYRSMFSTYMDSSSTWWNLISNRHRNGSSDGYNYGMYIKCRLTGSWAHLLWNRQYGGSWQGERTIHDTGNVCISSSNPGNGSFYGQIWFKI